ncbi:hypothetical protein [Janibacter sp. YB324]|uniref:hypothetical protein n=1 Tax=Janibacter sp. YB324 TaxID=2761047 RepID=UPI001627EA00|nr:hypothetical protein [Janibacter sp. YB324]QNF93905.1 hypothetical protein H7A72_14425 [Janibacter sp. YB324]
MRTARPSSPGRRGRLAAVVDGAVVVGVVDVLDDVGGVLLVVEPLELADVAAVGSPVGAAWVPQPASAAPAISATSAARP